MQWVRRSGASWMGLGRTVGLALCLVLVGSCSELAETDRASSFLVIERLTGGSGPGQEDTVFQSDVLSNGGVFEDQGTVTARLALKDPGLSGSPTTPTSANSITINRYRVAYVRTDGGAVPAPFEGAMTFTVTGAAAAGSICARSRLGQAAGAAHQPPGWRQLDCYLHGRRGHVLRSRPDRQGDHRHGANRRELRRLGRLARPRRLNGQTEWDEDDS